MQQQLERERVALLPQGKARLRLRPDVPRGDVEGSSAARRQCGRCDGVPPRAHRRVIRWGDGASGGVDCGRSKGGRSCRRWRCRDARLGLVAGFKQLCVRRLSVSVVIKGLVLRQDSRQILQKGHEVFRNRRVRRGGLRLLVRHRPVVVMISRGPARPWLGELLEKVV